MPTYIIWATYNYMTLYLRTPGVPIPRRRNSGELSSEQNKGLIGTLPPINYEIIIKSHGSAEDLVRIEKPDHSNLAHPWA